MRGFQYPDSMRKVEYATPNCSACMLRKDTRLQLFGAGGKKILILLDAQDASQQSLKTYGTGEKFSVIKDILEQYGIDIAEDCWTSSVVQCFTLEPAEKNAICCKPLTDRLINTLKPTLIIAFGELCAKVLLDGLITDGIYLDRVHGVVHNSRTYGCNIMFTYMPHKPTYNTTVDDLIIRRDIHRAVISLHSKRRQWKDEKSCVRILGEDAAIAQLEDCIKNPVKRFAALDYETNSLRPYNKNAKVLSMAISESANDSFSFQLTEKVIPHMVRYWQTEHIMKIAHNTAFERMWTAVKLHVLPVNLKVDTMILMHVLDNRETTFLSIKFLAPMLLGCGSWDGFISRYIDATREDKIGYGSYALNAMEQAPVRQLLLYNGIDSLVEYRVFIELMELLNTYGLTFPNEDTIETYKVGW